MGNRATLSKRDERFREESLHGNILKVVLTVGTPLALYQLLSIFFSILDTIMASHIGVSSVSAVAYLAQLSTLLSALGEGLSVGAGIMISRSYGEGDQSLVQKRVSTIYCLCLVAGILLAITVIPFAAAFLKLAGTPAELIEVGLGYFRCQVLVLIVTFLNHVFLAVERSRGNAGRIFRLNLLVVVIKLSLTALFVYGLSGNLVTLSLASLLSQLAMFAFALYDNLRGDGAFTFSVGALDFSRPVVMPMLVQAVPVIFQKASFALGKTVVNSMCTVYGSSMVGAMGISNNLGGITTNPQGGFQDGSASLISQNFGARQFRRVLKIFYVTLAINAILGAIISVLELTNLTFLSGLFGADSPDFQALIAQTYRYEALGAVPLGINAAVLSLLYGLGMTRLTLLLAFSRIFLFRIPVFWFLQNFTDFGDKSVGLVMMISNICASLSAVLVAFFVLRSFKRKNLKK